MDKSYVEQRIVKTKAMIEAYEDALIAIGSGAVESYDLDTGQTRQKVTKQNLKEMQDVLDGLYNRLCILEERLNGGNTRTVRPAW